MNNMPEIDINRISDEDLLISQIDGYEEYDSFELNSHLEDFFRFLGSNDYDIVLLSFLLEKRQQDVGFILNKTQAAVSYDINRLKVQMDFVVHINSIYDEFIDFIMDKNSKFSLEEINILIAFFFSTSFTKASLIVNQHQITFRANFNKILVKLKNEGFQNIYEHFEYIRCNLNKIKKTVNK